MEQSGKVIIFDTEEDAKIWFQVIEDTKYRGMIESKRMEMESWIDRNEVFCEKYQNRIRKIRKELGLSGHDVAERLNISTQYLYDIERGKRGLSAEILGDISDILKATTDYLIGKIDVNLYNENKRYGVTT